MEGVGGAGHGHVWAGEPRPHWGGLAVSGSREPPSSWRPQAVLDKVVHSTRGCSRARNASDNTIRRSVHTVMETVAIRPQH